MTVNPGFAGILIAVGVVVVVVVGLPIARWFLLGAILAGGALAFVLHLRD
jgi:hypothetical protein